MQIEDSATDLDQCQQRANQYWLKGYYDRAASLYEQAIAAEPDVKSHYWHLGLMLLLQRQEVEAQTTWFLAIVEGEPAQVEVWNAELVEILQAEAQRQEALVEYSVAQMLRQQIRELSPTEINNLLHLIELAIRIGDYTGEELTILGVVESLCLAQPIAVEFELLMQVLRGVLSYVPFHPSTLELVEACLAHVHGEAQTLTFLNILVPASLKIAYSQRLAGAAAIIVEMGLRLDAENPELLHHLAGFYQNSARYDEGINTAKLYYSLLQELPDKISANKLVLRGLMNEGGRWEEIFAVSQEQESLLKLLIEEKPTQLEGLRVQRLINAPYFAPYVQDEPRKNRRIQNQLAQICHANTQIYGKDQVEKYSQQRKKRQQLNVHTKTLKLGYLSHCLRVHSVGWLARWLFQHHDRDRFQINGYFINCEQVQEPLHQWYLSQVGQAYKSNKAFETAEQIHQDEIDILIDLDSITIDTSCEVLALKPAPIQVTWLGWDASGIPGIDYFIADPYVLPDSAQEYYAEKIWRLPQTYIAVDGFEVGIPTLRRDQLDIPADAVIYLSGQRGYKRHPATARLQMRIIKEVPNSYFLIKGIANEQSIKSFFAQIAEEEGVNYDQLRFLPEVFTEDVHRANLGIADVVLDTYPYNGATTTLETLWMCIPLVTRVGEQFAARNSYTMMMNAGVIEGIAWTDEEYVEWGVRLGKDEALRQRISWKLRSSRKTAPLWNAKRFTREMEKAYEQMWQMYTEGVG